MSKNLKHAIKKSMKDYNPPIKHPKHSHFDTYLLRKYVSIPIVFGIGAAVLTHYLYGTEELLRNLLSWTVGVTLVVTLVAALSKRKNI